ISLKTGELKKTSAPFCRPTESLKIYFQECHDDGLTRIFDHNFRRINKLLTNDLSPGRFKRPPLQIPWYQKKD
ncbi:MAG: hypothetical protein WCQ87_10025, partial [Parabacteroides sp.]